MSWMGRKLRAPMVVGWPSKKSQQKKWWRGGLTATSRRRPATISKTWSQPATTTTSAQIRTNANICSRTTLSWGGRRSSYNSATTCHYAKLHWQKCSERVRFRCWLSSKFLGSTRWKLCLWQWPFLIDTCSKFQWDMHKKLIPSTWMHSCARVCSLQPSFSSRRNLTFLTWYMLFKNWKALPLRKKC